MTTQEDVAGTAYNAETRVARFQSDVKSMPVERVVSRHITSGECFAIEQAEYSDLRIEVAANFGLHHNSVLAVGSAKLGFSIASGKRYQHFGDKSDIDLAIISSDLFDKIWHQVFDYWNANGSEGWEPDFRKYLFRGWIRPDKLPPQERFSVSQDWWNFFLSITNQGKYGQYPIKGGLYKSFHFLETYQAQMVHECRLELGDRE